MKKKSIAAAVLAAAVLSTGTAFAAENPFTDVPANHWAYDAVRMLAEDGVLEGYGDGTFRGDRLMNRYEMAEIVAKALERYDIARPSDRGAMNKLKTEFADELKDMDLRIKALENDVATMKKGMSSFKWWGDARMRAFMNKTGQAVKGSTASYRNQYLNDVNTEMRMRLGFYGEPAENLSVTGQLKFEKANVAASSNSGDHNLYDDERHYERVRVNRLQLDWHGKNGFTVSAGRNELSMGQGLIYWENPIDGVMVRKDFKGGSLMLGAGDASASTWTGDSEFATLADLSVNLGPAVKLTASYYASHSDSKGKIGVVESWDKGATWWQNWHNNYATRNFRQFALGVNAQLSKKWNLIAEGIHNSGDVTYTSDADTTAITDTKQSDDRNGFWTRLTYGNQDWGKANTWKVYAEYMALGGLAVDSSGWAHRLNVSGGNGFGGAGAKGFGLGVSYMLAPNTNLELTYYKLKPYSSQPGYNNYKDTGFAALSYSF